MRIPEIRQIVQWLDEAKLDVIEIEGPDLRLRLERGTEATAGVAPTLRVDRAGLDDAPPGRVVHAPIAGVLRLQHPDRPEALAELGAEVQAGAVLALLQIGAIYVPVAAPTAGIVARLRAVPDALVGYGAPLFEILEPADGG